MGLIYNTETAVDRDIKTQLNSQTEFLNNENIVGRETAQQTELWSHNLTATGSYTITEDIILTGISISGTSSAGVPSQNIYAWIRVSTNIIGRLYISNSPAGSPGQTGQTFIPLPNWYLPKGTIIGMVEGDGSGTVTFIGYLS